MSAELETYLTLFASVRHKANLVADLIQQVQQFQDTLGQWPASPEWLAQTPDAEWPSLAALRLAMRDCVAESDKLGQAWLCIAEASKPGLRRPEEAMTSSLPEPQGTPAKIHPAQGRS